VTKEEYEMVKIYCNFCGAELTGKHRAMAQMKIQGLTTRGEELTLDYCGDCLKKVIGMEVFDYLIKAREERKKKWEQKLAAEEVNPDEH